MINWFFKLKIKHKFLLAFGSLLLLSFVLMIAGLYAMNRMLTNREIEKDAIEISGIVREVSLSISNFSYEGYKDPDFLKSGSSSKIVAIREALLQLDDRLSSLATDSEFLLNNSDESLFIDLQKIKNQLAESFESLVLLYQKRGFQDYGLEGELRAAIHAVEKSNYTYDLGLLLMLRRHEKDFFLRKDLKYVEKFQSDLDRFISEVETDTSGDNSEIIRLLELYGLKFAQVVNIEKEIGIEGDEGLLGKVSAQSGLFQNKAMALSEKIISSSEEWDRRFVIMLVTLLVLQLMIGSLLAILYSNIITRSIRDIRNAMISLSRGEFPEELYSRTADELGELKNALNMLIHRIRTAVSFASAIGKGELNTEYDRDLKEDVLAQAIIEMQEKLREADRGQKMINWENEGIARLGEILSENSYSLEEMGDEVLRSIAGHTGINQAAIYLLDNETTELVRLSTFAYGKKRFQDHRISKDQGLAGQAFLEMQPIYLKQIPSDYVKITSGLGEATPRSLLILPLKTNDEVLGVIEFANMDEMSDAIKHFLSRATDSFSAAVRNRQIAETTTALLKQSEERAYMLAQQEEEMRQNTEELIATQEELQRQKHELEKTINELKEELILREKEIQQLSS